MISKYNCKKFSLNHLKKKKIGLSLPDKFKQIIFPITVYRQYWRSAREKLFYNVEFDATSTGDISFTKISPGNAINK